MSIRWNGKVCFLEALLSPGSKYFEHAAKSYEQKIEKNIFWKLIKSREEKAVLGQVVSYVARDFLDLGSGTGYYAERIKARGGVVTCVDQSKGMIEILRAKEFSAIESSIEVLRVDKQYDYVIAAGCFEFVPELDSAYKVAATHLKVGGRLIILHPRAGVIGRCYQLIHFLWKCPTYMRSINEHRCVALKYNLEYTQQKGAGLLGRVFVFEKIA